MICEIASLMAGGGRSRRQIYNNKKNHLEKRGLNVKGGGYKFCRKRHRIAVHSSLSKIYWGSPANLIICYIENICYVYIERDRV